VRGDREKYAILSAHSRIARRWCIHRAFTLSGLYAVTVPLSSGAFP
jgi:hypothetical protein